MGLDLWLTVAVLVGAVYLFVSEKLPTDVVALLVSPTASLTGYAEPDLLDRGGAADPTLCPVLSAP